ncbi:tellurite resistance TerB family protein [Bosea sp. (in: a-proteobacteria)]|uniref:tellurite resistance TerB family protein n=1 Tax=Bosea sp. (in: a-proteobacteria) TaxID=1871050 RepID=UPI002FC5CD86
MFNAKSLLDALVSAGSQIGAQGGQPGAQGGSGGLAGMLGSLAQQVQQAGGAGGLTGKAGQIFGQATQGVQDAAQKTGLQQGATDIVGQLSGGKTPQQLIEQAKGMLGNNQLAAGALLGGLGALVFGTSAGRSLAGSAVKVGGLALVGGLAYKAYQNYQAGKPLIGAEQQALLPAPAGSGFEPEAASDANALIFIRAMIAASASDGHIDDAERGAILGGLREAGFDPEANTWLANEMAKPASVDELVEGAESPELAAQIYTAARIAINPDKPAEKDFLAGLAGSLGLDAELVANIDAAASAAKV